MLRIVLLPLVAILLQLGGAFPASTVPGQSPPTRADSCLGYDPDTINLLGRLERRTFPGPPNYQSIQAGDRPESGLYLALSQATCFQSTHPGAMAPDTARATTTVQLNLDSLGYEALRPLLGQRLRLRGRASPAISGHHHAPVVMFVDDFAPEREN